MGRAAALGNRVLFAAQGFKHNTGEKVREFAPRILRPKAFEKFSDDMAPMEVRLYQILALLLLPIVIIVSLVCIVVLNEIMTEIFGVSTLESTSQQGILGWFITGVTAGLFLLAAWTWFQWVRTRGFGLFPDGW